MKAIGISSAGMMLVEMSEQEQRGMRMMTDAVPLLFGRATLPMLSPFLGNATVPIGSDGAAVLDAPAIPRMTMTVVTPTKKQATKKPAKNAKSKAATESMRDKKCLRCFGKFHDDSRPNTRKFCETCKPVEAKACIVTPSPTVKDTHSRLDAIRAAAARVAANDLEPDPVELARLRHQRAQEREA